MRTLQVSLKNLEEVLTLSDCNVDYLGKVGSISRYKVNIVEGVKDYIVNYDTSHKAVFCGCEEFEFMGNLCCHALKILDHLKRHS